MSSSLSDPTGVTAQQPIGLYATGFTGDFDGWCTTGAEAWIAEAARHGITATLVGHPDDSINDLGEGSRPGSHVLALVEINGARYVLGIEQPYNEGPRPIYARELLPGDERWFRPLGSH